MHKMILKLATGVLYLSVIFFGSQAAYAACNPSDIKGSIDCGASNSAGVPVTNQPDKSINDTITVGLKLLSVVIGIAATVMIAIGGFRYVTSAGDTTKVANARKTIMFALIGLVIIVLNQLIIKFVLAKASTT